MASRLPLIWRDNIPLHKAHHLVCTTTKEKMKTFLRDLRWILPASLGLGALLSALPSRTGVPSEAFVVPVFAARTVDGGAWWIGWLAYSFLLLLGLSILTSLWRWSGAGRTLGLMLLLALLLRLGLGIALTYILPVAGYPTDVQQAGYVFKDAFNRDTQAWELARSTRPIWAAFDKSYSTDQYGGLLAVSALAYRYLSPDVHRPWLVILLSALTAAIGVALTWKATRQLWGESLAIPAAWIMTLYPESLLLGSSQMREPFLITFIAMIFWGVVDWQLNHNRRAWPWLAGGLAGLLLFSPGVAIFAILVLAGWIWLRGEHRRLSWRVILIGGGVLLVALLLLWVGLARGSFAGASPIEVVTHWLQTSMKWDIYLLERSSGWVQDIFRHTDERLHLPFVIGYGAAQPVLPAAIFDVTVWPWRAIGILRAIGWYAMLPFLFISLIAIWKIPVNNERTAWFWLWLFTWAWIIISAIRAGGDQWDNPRYRAIFLLWQAALASKAWMWWRASKSPWPLRILAVELLSLAFFSEWYASRYIGYIAKPSFGVMLTAIAITSGFILVGGWTWDRWRTSRRP